jgi:hypothetical protein
MNFSSPRSSVKLLTFRVMFGCGNCWYSKTCKAGHILAEPANSYDIIHGRYSITWQHVSWNLTAVANLLFSLYTPVTNLRLPTDLNNCMAFGSKSSFVSRTAFCLLSFHLFSTSMGNILEFTRGNWPNGKAVPLQAWSSPESSRKLRFPDFMTTAQDGGKVVSLKHRPPLPPVNRPGTHFY